MFFFKSKAFTTRQKVAIGFVLAVLSLLTSAVTVFIFPLFLNLVYDSGIYSLDWFYLAFMVTFFFATQGLILFGFPLWYAKDQKDHMTGFQILVYAILIMIVSVFLISGSAVGIKEFSSRVPTASGEEIGAVQ